MLQKNEKSTEIPIKVFLFRESNNESSKLKKNEKKIVRQNLSIKRNEKK